MNNITEQHGRFKGLPWYDSTQNRVIVGGAGGIGTWVSLFLARANFKINIFDFDTIETHNLSGQAFFEDQIGATKVAAIHQVITKFCGLSTNVSTFERKLDTSGPYVFSCFDNMRARKLAFENWKRNVNSDSELYPIYIDGRLEAEQLQIFCVTPDKIEEYEKHLFDDSRVAEAGCTEKQTTHTAAMIAGHMVAFFTNHLSNKMFGENIREVPFYYEYYTPANITETL
jgi:molybdopterin/thiamine biosynthesis adenylyltransferase